MSSNTAIILTLGVQASFRFRRRPLLLSPEGGALGEGRAMGRGRAVEGRSRGPVEGRAQLDLRLGGREPLVLRLQAKASEHFEHLSFLIISIRRYSCLSFSLCSPALLATPRDPGERTLAPRGPRRKSTAPWKAARKAGLVRAGGGEGTGTQGTVQG